MSLIIGKALMLNMKPRTLIFFFKNLKTNTMKKLVFTLAALGIAGATFAQTTFGVKAGPNFSGYTARESGTKESGKLMVGLSGGVYANVYISPKLYIQPSLMYEGKGGKEKEFGIKTRLNYLTLPVNLLFKPEIPNGNGSWIAGAGAYIGYGFSGNSTSNANDSTTIFSYYTDNPFKKAKYFNPLLKHFDAGADIQLGYEMASGFNIVLNAELGLISIFNNNQYSNWDKDNFFRNTSFSVMVGYTFRHTGASLK